MPALGLALGLPFRTMGGGGAPTAPATPTGLIATPGNQQTTISWDAQPEADSFTIYYGLTDTFGLATELTNAATGTSFVHDSGESIVVGELYYYWIQAVNGAGSSSFSSSASARSFVTLADAEIGNFVTPTGLWTLSTLFFRTGGNLPINCQVVWGTLPDLDIGLSLGDGTWEDLVNGGLFDPPISGAFEFTNSSGSPVTFWNTEP